MGELPLLHKGKVKEVRDAGTELEFFFTDQISVFDKIIPTLVPHKGETLCRISAHWFSLCEARGIATHFLTMPAPDRMRVTKVQVIRDYAAIGPRTTNYLVPLEVVARYYVAGSMNDRLKAGEVKPEELGLSEMPKYGDPLPAPYIEFTTKLEPVDRHLTEDEAKQMACLTDQELDDLKQAVIRVDEFLNEDVARRGLIHVDGKKEFAMDENRELMLIDTFGTPDEDRFWDRAAYDQGKFLELSKEAVRQHYRSTGYLGQLEAARKAGLPEPPIPALPPDVTAKVSTLYTDLFERLTGEAFR